MRERLTYRFFIQLIGAIVAFVIVVIKILKIKIGSLDPGDVESIILAAGGIAAVVVPFFIPDSNKPIFPSKDSPLSDATRKDNRQRMLDKVENIWITGYLDHVLNEMAALRLDMKFVEPEKVLQRVGMKDEDLPDSGSLLSAFNELGRRLVILGEPGAGKTVTLLQLCCELIGEARKDERKPIPVVLALSSWAAEQLPFEEWLRKEVYEKYGLPSREVARNLVQGEQLLYLLDGLDEVAEAQRDACLQAIKRFVEVERPVNYVVCCRRKEFAELPTRLKIAGEVILQPLDDEQIGEYLSGDEFAGLPAIWAESKILREFGRIPFMLNTIAMVTRGKSERNIRLELKALNAPARLRNEILEAYTNRRLQEMTTLHYPNLRHTREQLKWLAQRLIMQGQTDFYIENLQPDWLGTEARIKRYRWTGGLAFVLVGGLVGGLVGWLTLGPVFGLVFGLVGGLISGQEFKLGKIIVVDRLRWSLSRSGLVSGLVFGLVGGLGFGLALGLAFGLGFGLAGGQRVELHTQPNAGIQRSLSNFLIVWLVIGLAVGLVIVVAGTLAGTLADGLGFGLAVGLGFGVANGGGAIIKHSTLRFFLAHASRIPYWRYDKFLDYCADLVILRKVGGGYRFVHDYMRQYLASAAFVPDVPLPPPEN